jgi:hypothetical protein
LYQVEVADFAATRQENNGNLNRALFMKLAGQVKLNAATFGQCIDSGKYADAIQRDNTAAGAIGVQSTPTTFVNGVKVVALDAKGNPVPDPRTGGTQGVGADGKLILSAIEAALK